MPLHPDRRRKRHEGRHPEGVASEMLGHSNPAITRTYLQLGSKAAAIQSRLAMEVGNVNHARGNVFAALGLQDFGLVVIAAQTKFRKEK